MLVLGRVEEAIATIETAMRFDPKASAGPHVQLATAYYMAGRYRDTLSYADLVLARSPHIGGMHAIRAAALAQLGDEGEARKAAADVRRWNPNFRTDEAGTRFRDPGMAQKLRDGLTKAGL